ncbi:MAG: hypothetical protein VXW65_02760 [Pseudomonadota bacterium]|nr:hypothetical protein [Pseudomonadota bacterium]
MSVKNLRIGGADAFGCSEKISLCPCWVASSKPHDHPMIRPSSMRFNSKNAILIEKTRNKIMYSKGLRLAFTCFAYLFENKPHASGCQVLFLTIKTLF